MAANDLTSTTGGYTYDPSVKPPPFGHGLKKYWAFDEGYVNLNHGSYGSLPLPVLSECSKLSLQVERNPDKFHRETYIPMLIESRRLVADLLGAKLDEVVLVPNATHGVNTVLRNFEWREGDVLIGASTTYGAVSKTMQYIGDRSEPPRPAIHTILYQFPMTHTDILDKFRSRIREIKQAHSESEFNDVPSEALSVENASGVKKNKLVAVIDSLTSNPGVLLPWQEMVRICKEEGIWSVVDAAHSIGQEVGVNLGEVKPDFWISNLHKWLYVKRGCAVLYVPERNQHIIKSSIPTSHAYGPASPLDPRAGPAVEGATSGNCFVDQHEWTGTCDLVPYLSVKASLDFRKWIGGEEAINAYCHDLAIEGGKKLAEILGTKLMDESGELTLNMTNVLLPLPVDTPGAPSVYTPEILGKINATLRQTLLNDWNTYVAHYYHAGGWWCRCSAQVWNEVSDFEYVGNALDAICKDINETVFAKSAQVV